MAGGPPPPAETEFSEFGREVLESPGPGLARPLLVGCTGSDVCSARPASRAPLRPETGGPWVRRFGVRAPGWECVIGELAPQAGQVGFPKMPLCYAPPGPGLLPLPRAAPPPASGPPWLQVPVALARAPLSGPVDRPPRCRQIRGRIGRGCREKRSLGAACDSGRSLGKGRTAGLPPRALPWDSGQGRAST